MPPCCLHRHSFLFLSTPSARRATPVRCRTPLRCRFLSTPSARRATWQTLRSRCRPAYFYPRPLRGGRRRTHTVFQPDRVFLSTPSARRATSAGAVSGAVGAISIHALCEEGDSTATSLGYSVEISIHALCEEGDGGHGAGPHHHLRISIHALCEEGDPCRPPC